jgi:pectinesterase
VPVWLSRTLGALCALVLIVPGLSAAETRLKVSADPRAAFHTIQGAIDALPAQGGRIDIAPGHYREKIAVKKKGVRLVGRGRGPQDVVVVWSDSAKTAGGTFQSYTMNVEADGFMARNLTIQNDYHLTGGPQAQAVALAVTGDQAVFDRVRLLGAQDTLYAASRKTKPSRQYFKNCYIEGHVDFIFGDAKAFFDRCELHALAHDGVLITAQSKSRPDQDSAYVFDRCVITADPQAQNIYLGRAWRPYATVVFMRSRMLAPVQPDGWREWTPGKTQTLATAYFAEFASSGPGARPQAREPQSHQLTASQAAGWSKKVFLAGDDRWAPH